MLNELLSDLRVCVQKGLNLCLRVFASRAFHHHLVMLSVLSSWAVEKRGGGKEGGHLARLSQVHWIGMGLEDVNSMGVESFQCHTVLSLEGIPDASGVHGGGGVVSLSQVTR